MRLLLLIAALVLPATAQAAPLAWPPPPQIQPTHYDIRPAAASGMIEIARDAYPYGNSTLAAQPADRIVQIRLRDGEDATIALPRDQTLDIPGLTVAYGRNVRIIGGAIRATMPADHGLRAVLRFAGQSGGVFVEGLVLDANGQYGLDGLDVGSVMHKPGDVADVTVENCLIKGTYSTQQGLHADGFQFYGNVGAVRMDHVSIAAQYQGLFLDPQSDIGSIDLRHVDLRYVDPASGAGYLFFLRTGLPNPRHPPVRLQDVYVEARTNRLPWEKFTIYPPAGRSDGVVLTDGRGTFPALPEVQGYITRGLPPGGAFVKTGDVGPGYMPGSYARPAH